MTGPEALSGGFADPVFQSQAVFRGVLDAFARPGTVFAVPPAVRPPPPLHCAAGAFLSALADVGTPVWLDAAFAGSGAAAWLAFHTGAPRAAVPEEAAFAVVAAPATAPRLDAFALGSAEYPDRSTTVVLQIDDFSGPALRLEGPGIRETASIAPRPLPPGLLGQLSANRALFPRGVDVVLAAPDSLAVLPRPVRVEAGEAA